MSPELQKLVGQAVIRLIAGDRKQAIELLTKAYEASRHEKHLHASIQEILEYKKGRQIA